MYDTVTIGDVCEVIAGQSPPSDTYNKNGEGLPFFQGKADFGYLYPERIRIWCNAPQKIAEEGDVLISVRAPVGPTNICNQRACIGRGLSAIRAGNTVDQKYLLYFLRKYEPKLASQGKGSTFMSITQKDIKRIQMPLPSLADQKRIVSLLDQADALRRKRRESMKLLDKYVQAVFIEMFGDPVMNPKGWHLTTIGELIDFMTSGSRGWAKYYAQSGDKFLRIQNVTKNKLKLDDLAFVTAPNTAEARRTQVQKGDVLLSITADLGRTAVIPDNFGNAYISQHLALLRFKPSINSFFVSEFLSSPGGLYQMNRLNKGGVKAGLNFNDVKSIRVPIPPIELQNQYERRCMMIEQMRNMMLTQSHEINNQFNALRQKAFAGAL